VPVGGAVRSVAKAGLRKPGATDFLPFVGLSLDGTTQKLQASPDTNSARQKVFRFFVENLGVFGPVARRDAAMRPPPQI
jgi:hypothetical protein